jgi:hypothetical protein
LLLLVSSKNINHAGHDEWPRDSEHADRIAALADAVFHSIVAIARQLFYLLWFAMRYDELHL